MAVRRSKLKELAKGINRIKDKIRKTVKIADLHLSVKLRQIMQPNTECKKNDSMIIL